MRLSTGTNRNQGSASDRATHSSAGSVSSSLPLRASRATSQQLIEEM